MSNGEVCCILGVCCPPGSAAQAHALDEMIQKSRPHFNADQVQAARERVLEHFTNFSDTAKIIDAA